VQILLPQPPKPTFHKAPTHKRRGFGHSRPEARKQEIEDEIADIERLAEDEDYEPHDDEEQRYAALQAELTMIVERA
uniref:hypothetical protein n=1 Tax=Sphingobium xenophagum TaxID=121428 RepID=UPI00241C5FD2